LSTARTVLRLLTLLAESEQGLRADEAASALGKSVSTAYNLLDSLCAEGFAVHGERGRYQLTARGSVPTRRSLGDYFGAVLEELFRVTRKRAYVAAAQRGRVVIPHVRGRQGIRRLPGLDGEIRANAHALALGKVVLALQDDAAVNGYVDEGLSVFTPRTIVDPDVLRAELREVRRSGVASDCEEFDDDFCCIAAPVFNRRGQAVAVLGISMTAHCFASERAQLSQQVAQVARRAGQALPAAALPTIQEEAGRS